MKSKSGRLLFMQPIGRGNFVLFQDPAFRSELRLLQTFQQYQACLILILYELEIINV
jgi:hypothetical protein